MKKKILRPLCDRIGRDAVDRVTARFYDRLREDAQLSPFFAHILNFPEHERRIADFWWIAMGGRLADPPTVDMLGLHRPMGMRQADLDRWLELFAETVEDELETDLAEQWKAMAEGIGRRLAQGAIE